MNLNEHIKHLSLCLESLLVDFELKSGLKVGGAINVCRADGAPWTRIETITIRREMRESAVTSTPRNPSPPIVYARTAGPSGDVCVNCGGSNLQQSGACKVCTDCGTSGGCG